MVATRGRSTSVNLRFFSQVCFTPTTKLTGREVSAPTVLPSVLNTLLWLGLVVASNCVNGGKRVDLFVGVQL
jgi:hypothetical protein